LNHNPYNLFFIAYTTWILFGGILLVRAFIVIFRKLRAMSADDMAARKREVQRQFQIVGLIWMATLPIVLGVYYFTRH
jgi:uncharacterized membrane protein